MADYSNSKCEITILAPRIFKLMPFEGIEMDVNDVEEMRRVYLEFSERKTFAVLLDARHGFVPTLEARALIASEAYSKQRIAAALVAKSLANRIIGNFFIKVNKPSSPTRLFSDEASAFEWLKEQLKLHDGNAK